VATVTADTNLYVSAFNFGGRPLQLIELARAGAIQLAISDDIQAEVRRVLRDKFGWPEDDLNQLDADLASFTVKVRPSRRLAVVKADPDDDRILECAVASGSVVLVSGDKHLLNLGQHEGIPIIRVSDFLERQQQRAW
jgi:putative PIN family toxin of toxin-antitoxin system